MEGPSSKAWVLGKARSGGESLEIMGFRVTSQFLYKSLSCAWSLRAVALQQAGGSHDSLSQCKDKLNVATFHGQRVGLGQ